jgi:uncharacterized protein (TIGR03437 family)
VTAGSASVNPAAMLTNAQGQASTTVTAGNSPGSITITAAYAGLTSTASLTVKAVGPAITATSFFNTASFQVGLAPCGLNTVVGSGIAPNVSGTVLGNPLGFGPLPYTLQGLSITVNAIPAPIQSISNINGTQQATFQTPCETVAGSATTVVITVNGATTTVTGVQVFTYQPGIFTYAGPNNKLYGAVIRKADGSYVTPSNQAHRGENYYLVVTGLGQISPPITTNSAGTGQAYPINQLVVGVNNAGVPVISAQYVAGSIGVYIIEFQIPANAPTGVDQPLAVGVIQNGQTVFGNSVFIPGVI